MLTKKINNTLKKMTYRPDIDALRAIAVLAVIGFHAFPSALRGGVVGVDIFFVISGYLITKIIFDALNSHSFRFVTFYARRVRRIFPSLVFLLAVILPLGYLLLLPDEFSQLGKHVFSGSIYISNFTLLNESVYFDPDAETKLLLHLWSLAIEEQFYIFWPVVAFLIHRFTTKHFLVVFIFFIASFLSCCIAYRISAVTAFYLPFTRCWELLLGALLTLGESAAPDTIDKTLHRTIFSFKNQNITVKKIVFCASLLLIILTIVFIQHKHAFLGSIIATIGAAALLLSRGPSLFSNKLLITIGLISYPLYLWHWPILSFGRIYEGTASENEYRIIAIFASFLLAGFTYAFVERSLRFGKYLRAKTGALVVSLCIIGFFGALVAHKQGFQERSELRKMANNLKNLERTEPTDRNGISYINFDEKEPPFTYCKFSDAAAPDTVAIIGDSHAHAAYPGLAAALKQRGFNSTLMANSSCPPLLGAPTGITVPKQHQCDKQISAILNTVVEKADIKDVFIFTRGPIYFTGTSVEATKPSRCPDMDIKTFFDGLQRTIDFLDKHGKKVFYVIENPELLYDPRSCLSRPFRTPTHDCSMQKVEVAARQEQYLSGLSQLSGGTIVDTTALFCPTDSCMAFWNGNLLYADSDHLSVYGSEFLANFILHQLSN